MNPPALHLLDTITAIDASHAGCVIVSGSHGGVSSTDFVLRAPAKPLAVFFNDAGVGKDRAGVVALELLDAIGVACAVYSHESARIGEARDGFENGVVTEVNRAAQAAGVAAGLRVKDAVAVLRGGGGAKAHRGSGGVEVHRGSGGVEVRRGGGR